MLKGGRGITKRGRIGERVNKVSTPSVYSGAKTEENATFGDMTATLERNI